MSPLDTDDRAGGFRPKLVKVSDLREDQRKARP